MTTVDPTRPGPASAPLTDGGLDELVDGSDPLACESCLAAAGECELHRGWANGWDACAAFVARIAHDDREAELGHPAVVDAQEVDR